MPSNKASPLRPFHKEGVAIFDLDDTLVDREATFVKAQTALLEVLRSQGLNIEPRAELDRLRAVDTKLIEYHGKLMYDYRELAAALWLIYNGMTEDEAIRTSIKSWPPDVAKIASVARERHDNALEEIPQLIDGAERVLDYLKRNYVLVLLTEGDKRHQMRVIRHYNFQFTFDEIVVRDSKTIEDFKLAKENGLRILREKYGGGPQNVFVIGDRISRDIEPGNAINAKTILIPGPYNSGKPELSHQRPMLTISKLTDLLNVL